MVAIYPISNVKRMFYRGKDSRKQAKASAYNILSDRIEKYLNAKIEADPAPFQQFLYYKIAHDLGVLEDEVRERCFQVDCGSHGLTVHKSGR